MEPVRVRVSVVVPAYNAAGLIRECLAALGTQSLPRADYELIVVDDGSSDGTAQVAAGFEGVRVISQPNRGAPAARNAGMRAAGAPWVAFTDADCIPSRGWLAALLAAVAGEGRALGAAGRTLGFQSESPAARFVDLSGGFDTERHLQHPRFPFAPSGNAMYRRELLERVGGFDERFATYEACDLHRRLRAVSDAPMHFAPRAVVLHRHRSGWRAYFRQQRGYGYGYGQFAWRHRGEVRWTPGRELAAWAGLCADGLAALLPAAGDAALLRRGRFVKGLAQRLGFDAAYYSSSERRRW